MLQGEIKGESLVYLRNIFFVIFTLCKILTRKSLFTEFTALVKLELIPFLKNLVLLVESLVVLLSLKIFLTLVLLLNL